MTTPPQHPWTQKEIDTIERTLTLLETHGRELSLEEQKFMQDAYNTLGLHYGVAAAIVRSVRKSKALIESETQ